MSSYELILVEDPAPAVRRLRLNRPGKRNALDERDGKFGDYRAGTSPSE